MILDVVGLRCIEDGWLTRATGFDCFVVKPENSVLAQPRRGSHNRAFFTAKVSVSDLARVRSLTQRGFDLVDTALTFRCEPDLHYVAKGAELAPNIVINSATADDLKAAEALAGVAFRHSRFHLDPRFPSAIADQVKRLWTRNIVMGERGAGCLVGHRDGRVVSFLGYQQAGQSNPAYVIDLMAVSPEEQGRGVGRATLGVMLDRATQDGRAVVAGTQAANTASVRMYEAMGFRLESATYVMHGHAMTSETP